MIPKFAYGAYEASLIYTIYGAFAMQHERAVHACSRSIANFASFEHYVVMCEPFYVPILYGSNVGQRSYAKRTPSIHELYGCQCSTHFKVTKC